MGTVGLDSSIAGAYLLQETPYQGHRGEETSFEINHFLHTHLC